MDIQLDQVEVRVLGSLVEKEITTPDYYPLSLNALVNACNQKSNRDPVMSLAESDVREALESLRDKNLARQVSSFDSRVPKYGHQLQEVFNFDRRETAVIAVLLLRGPQTPGEIRGRADRMYHFEDLEAAESTLNRLIDRDPPLVKRLARQPGTKESRYAHLLAGDVEPGSILPEPVAAGAEESGQVYDERLAQLGSEVDRLREEVADLRRQLADFRKQFE